MRAASTAVSFAVHVILVLAAVRATARGAAAPRTIFVVESLPLPATSGPVHRGPVGLPRVPDAQVPDVPLLPIPGDGEFALGQGDTSVWRRPGGVDSAAGPALFGGGAPLEVTLVEDPPVLLAGPVAAYPELLRQAGLEGRVVLEAVIDTTGRVEPGSITVVAATNPGFVDAARRALAGALFRPARVHGRAVRVRIRLPTEFVLGRHR